ncbi:MAG: hypothetical protein GY714_02405 [Desulfobacterales bacterium]|nr:hypothetical protein [Desulfobacterales bacterium]
MDYGDFNLNLWIFISLFGVVSGFVTAHYSWKTFLKHFGIFGILLPVILLYYGIAARPDGDFVGYFTGFFITFPLCFSIASPFYAIPHVLRKKKEQKNKDEQIRLHKEKVELRQNDYELKQQQTKIEKDKEIQNHNEKYKELHKKQNPHLYED